MRSAIPQSKITLTQKEKHDKMPNGLDVRNEKEKKLCRPPQLRLLINIINTRMQEPTENSNTYTAGRKKQGKCAPWAMRCSFVLRLKEAAISGEKWKE